MESSKNKILLKLIGRIFLIKNKVSKLPATHNWLLYNEEGKSWNEEIRQDLIRGFPTIEAVLINRIENDLIIVIKMLIKIIDEQSERGKAAQKVLPELIAIQEENLLDKVLQNFYLYHLAPENQLVHANFIKINWQKINNAVINLFNEIVINDKNNPIFAHCISLDKNIKNMGKRIYLLLNRK